MRESDSLMLEAKEVVEEVLDRNLNYGNSDWSRLKNLIKDALSEFLWKRMKRTPMILPIIIEVD